MSKILKIPMFRIGGSANDGIISMAAPRKNYAIGTEYRQKYEQTLPMIMEAIGPGRDDRLANLLIRGGLRTLSERPAGNIFATVGRAFTPAVDEYLKGEDTE